MSELLPTLRESLRETAERRHRRRRRRPLVPALIAVAAVAAALILMAQRDGTQPADEVPATPTATFTPTFAPSPAATPRVMPGLDPKDLHATPVAPDDSSLKEALSLLDESHQVVRAWKVRGLEGHVLLTLNTIRIRQQYRAPATRNQSPSVGTVSGAGCSRRNSASSSDSYGGGYRSMGCARPQVAALTPHPRR